MLCPSPPRYIGKLLQTLLIETEGNMVVVIYLAQEGVCSLSSSSSYYYDGYSVSATHKKTWWNIYNVYLKKEEIYRMIIIIQVVSCYSPCFVGSRVRRKKYTDSEKRTPHCPSKWQRQKLTFITKKGNIERVIIIIQVVRCYSPCCFLGSRKKKKMLICSKP